MCPRPCILARGLRDGAGAAEIKVDLPHPRSRFEGYFWPLVEPNKAVTGRYGTRAEAQVADFIRIRRADNPHLLSAIASCISGAGR
jgi:hypothetical protein